MVVAYGALTTGLNSNAQKAYMEAVPTYAWLDLIAERDKDSTADTENYAAPESVDGFKRKDRGADVPFDDFKFYTWSTKNLNWETGIEWHRNDRINDKTGTLYGQATSKGQLAAALDEEIIVKQMIAGTADATLLDAIPNAPDGLANFSASTRFGLSGGNINSGGGVASDDAVLTDFFDVWGDFSRMTNTKGKPYHNLGKLKRFLVLYRGTNQEVFASAFIQKLRAKAVVTSTSNASVSNLISDMGIQVELAPTAYLPDNDWYIFALDSGVKPYYTQKREGLRMLPQDESNSDRARRDDMEGAIWKFYRGYGSDVPLSAMKVNN